MTAPACKVCGSPVASRRAKYCAQCRPPGKYRNKSVVVDGFRFDSKKEAARWVELKALGAAGLLDELTRQVRFPIIINKQKVCDYVADFTYVIDGTRVVEDVKGRRTDVYKLKKKLMKACYEVEVEET